MKSNNFETSRDRLGVKDNGDLSDILPLFLELARAFVIFVCSLPH